MRRSRPRHLSAKRGIAVGVVDMPSIDEAKLLSLSASGKLIVFAEQNNGFLWQNALKTAARHGKSLGRIVAVNTLTREMKPAFIHSGTYEQLLDAFQSFSREACGPYYREFGMSVPCIHEDDVEAVDLPGRNLRWMMNTEILGSKYMSTCLIKVAPGDRVRPAHSHPNGEEAIYIITGTGRVLVNGEVSPIKAGSLIPFPQGPGSYGA